MLTLLLLTVCSGFVLENSSGYIRWPSNSWVISPIISSSWHAGETVTLTVTFTSSVSLSSGIIQLSFPSIFKVNLLTSTLTKPVNAGEDYSVTFANFLLPAQGAYGPIGIYLKASATGSIAAGNAYFFVAYVDKVKPTPVANSLIPTFYDVTKVYVGVQSSIYFDFVITMNLWKYDMFYLYVDSRFSISSPVCKSLKVIAEYNNLNSTNPESLNTLQCNYDSVNNRVIIYGLGVDLYIKSLSTTGSITGRLLISGFTNPSADYDDTSYKWSLYIGRFSVNSFFAAYTGSGPSTQPGTISVTSWLPRNGYSINNIPLGLTLYMDLTVNFPHSIPTTGQISLQFSGGINNLQSSWRYFVDGSQQQINGDGGYLFTSPYIGGTCTVTATTIICNGFPKMINAGTVVFTTYTNFISTSPSVMQITTYNDLGVTIIDQVTANPATVTYAVVTSVVKLTSFELYFSSSKDTSSGNYIYNTGVAPSYMNFIVQSPVDLTAQTFNLFMPVSSSTSETTVKITSGLTGLSKTAAVLSRDLTAAATPVTNVAVNSGKISFTASAINTQFLSAVFSGTMMLPYVGSNLNTRYEVRLEVTVSSVLYVYSNALSFKPSSPTVTFNLLCVDAAQAGIPATVSFTPPFAYSLSQASTLNIEIKISGTMASDFDSGLTSGEIFPSYSSISGNLYGDFSSAPIVFWSNITTLATSVVSITFPIGKMTNLVSYSAAVRVYYADTLRSDVQYEILSMTSAAVQSLTNTANWNTQTLPATSYATSEAITSMLLTINTATPATASGYLGLILPTGFRVATASVTKAGSAMVGVYSFTSTNINFKNPGIFATVDNSHTLPTADTVFSYQGITTSHYAVPGTFTPLQASNTPNLVCVSITGTHPILTITEGIINTPVFTPATATGAGPETFKLDISATFANTHFIPKGGRIDLVFASNWKVTTITTCSIRINNVDTSSVVISISSTVSITNLPLVPAGSQILVTMTNTVPPANSQKTSSKSGHFSSITTYATSDTSQSIDKYTDILSTSLTLSPSASSGNITITDVSFFPNATSSSAFFRLQFKVNSSLPVGTVVTVSSIVDTWVVSGDISKGCYFSVNYTSCSCDSSTVSVVIGAEVPALSTLVIMVDNALKLTQTDLALSKLTVTTKYAGYIIDQSPAGVNTTSVYGNSQSLAALLSVFPSTSCQIANYTFTISNSISAGAVVNIVFPPDYDALLGIVTETFAVTQPGVYYLTCSTDLGNIDCLVNRRVVTFTLPAAITTSANITLTGIINPQVSQTNLITKIYINSTADNKFYLNELVTIPTSVALPTSYISIRSITATNVYLQKTADFTLNFYLSSNTAAEDVLVVWFPEMFNLERDSGVSFVCRATYKNTEYAVNASLSLNTTGVCLNLRNNYIGLQLNEAMVWNSSYMISLTILGIQNPEWGYTMTKALDSTAYSIFDVWTTQLGLGVFSKTSFTAVSPFGFNTAYIGFNKNQYSFSVNNFNPITYKNTITLIPGTQSQDIYISTVSFQSKVAQVIPSNLNNKVTLKFSSATNFKFYNGDEYVVFRVSVPISATQSLNYITWTLVEVPVEGNTAKYTAPVKTRVEVYNSVQTLTVGSISAIPIGLSSLPIPVSLKFSPESILIVSMFTSTPNITFSPSSLQFTSNLNTLYYTVVINSNLSSDISQITVNYTLSGADSSAYSISPSQFQVTSLSQGSVSIKSVDFQNLQRSTLSVVVNTDIPSVICWQLGYKAATFMSYEDLINSTASLVGNNSMPSFDEQASKYFAGVDVAPRTGESWKAFQRRLYKDFIQQVWTGCTYTGSTSVNIFSINWLWAETDYKLMVIAGSANMTNTTVYPSTTAFGEGLNITLNILQTIDKSFLNTINNGLAGSLGIDNSQLQVIDSNLTISRIVELYNPDRHLNTAPIDTYNNITLAPLTTILNSIGIIATPTTQVTTLQRTQKYPAINVFALHSYSSSSISFQTNSTTVGEICCIAEHNLTGTLNASQIMLGINRNNSAAPAACVNNYALGDNYTLSLNGLTQGTAYNVSCVACDSYSVWPGCGVVFMNEYNTSATKGGGDNVISMAGYLCIQAIAALVIF